MNYIPKSLPIGFAPGKIVDPDKKQIIASVNGIYVTWRLNQQGKMQPVSKVKPGYMVDSGSSTYIPHDHYVGMVRQVNAIAHQRFHS